MSELNIRQKAEGIARLFRERRQIDILPSELMPSGLADAYRVRQIFEDIEIASRGAIAGYKIGLTTPIMQQLCDVDEPIYGAIFANEMHRGRAELPARNYCRLGIETEIALCLGEDLPTSGRSGSWRDRATGAVESCLAAIELLEDLHHDYKRLSAAAMVAGNVWTARLSINGREVGKGRGGDVMGNPLNALTWLAETRAAAGIPLRRGMIVMTGSMVPIQFPSAGDRAIVEVEGLGRAELVVT
jgi:2-keto-4-pentenoate hydratase